MYVIISKIRDDFYQPDKECFLRGLRKKVHTDINIMIFVYETDEEYFIHSTDF